MTYDPVALGVRAGRQAVEQIARNRRHGFIVLPGGGYREPGDGRPRPRGIGSLRARRIRRRESARNAEAAMRGSIFVYADGRTELSVIGQARASRSAPVLTFDDLRHAELWLIDALDKVHEAQGEP